MNIANDISQAFQDGYNECLAMLETAIFNASWHDNQDENVVWDLIQRLRK